MAKYKTPLLLSFALMLSAAAFAQRRQLAFWGTKTLYPAFSGKLTAAPAGYTPVFINHIGRHGARHLLKPVSGTLAYNLLHRADSAGALTAAGRQLWQMVQVLDGLEKDDLKSISAEGRLELQGIGRRMHTHYPMLFNDAPRLKVAITKELRTTQSADALLTGLQTGSVGKPVIDQYTDNTHLRFYDLSPAYQTFKQDGPWRVPFEKLKKTERINQVNHALNTRIFAPAFARQLLPAQLEQLTGDIFGFAGITYSLQVEMAQAGLKPDALNFEKLLSRNELRHLGRIDVADDYFKKGPGIDKRGIQVRVAVPLLVDFINAVDEFIQTGRYNAVLRIAHAETLAPFAALTGIRGADKTITRYNQLEDWPVRHIVPLAANIQWVLYNQKSTSNYLIKILLNEKEASINGLPVTLFPYYKWADVRKLYLQRLKQLGVGLNDDMVTYLNLIKAEAPSAKLLYL